MPLFHAVIRGIIFQQRCENVIHFINTSGGSAIDCAVKIRDVWCPTVQNLQNQNFSWFEVTVKMLDEGSSTWGVPEILTFANQPGVLQGAAAHPSLAFIFSLRRACSGRHCRGRIYLPGVHGESVSQGRVEAGALTTANQVKGLMLDRFYRAGNAFTGYSLAVAERTSPYAADFVEQITVRATFGIQRRRNIGVGS